MLVGHRYYEETDPGAVGAGLEWLQPSSGLLKIRNRANTEWVIVGQYNIVGMGLVDKATPNYMAGFIPPGSGYAPEDSAQFTGTVTIDTYTVATKKWVTDQFKTAYDSIEDLIDEASVARTVSVSYRNDITFVHGTTQINTDNPSFTISKPTFGATSVEYQNCAWGACFNHAYNAGAGIKLPTQYLNPGGINDGCYLMEVPNTYIATDNDGRWLGAWYRPMANVPAMTGYIYQSATNAPTYTGINRLAGPAVEGVYQGYPISTPKNGLLSNWFIIGVR